MRYVRSQSHDSLYSGDDAGYEEGKSVGTKKPIFAFPPLSPLRARTMSPSRVRAVLPSDESVMGSCVSYVSRLRRASKRGGAVVGIVWICKGGVGPLALGERMLMDVCSEDCGYVAG